VNLSVVHVVEVCAGAGDAYDVRARRGQRRRDTAAEPSARTGHDRGRAGEAVARCWLIHGFNSLSSSVGTCSDTSLVLIPRAAAINRCRPMNVGRRGYLYS
jgi:hypothetical protein